MGSQSEIEDILRFDPGASTKPNDDEIQEVLKFLPPVGGTFQPSQNPATVEEKPMLRYAPADYEQVEYEPGTEPSAGPLTLLQSSFPDDPLTKVKIFAKARGIPVSDIGRRYRITKDGDVEFKTTAGRWQRETPDLLKNTSMETAANIAAHPSSYLGPIGYGVGSATGIPGAGPALGTGMAMVGELTRKQIAKTAYDEPQTTWGVVQDVALEGLLALGGDMAAKLAGYAVNRFLSRKAPKILKRAGKDVAKGTFTAEEHARAIFIGDLAEKHGITLLPHQRYDKNGMTQMWIYLRNHPLTANQVQKFDDVLEAETQEAITGYVGQMGGYAEEPFALGTKLVKTADDAMEGAQDAIRTTAKPYYDAGLDDTPIINTAQLKAELKFNADKIAKGGAKPKPDVKRMAAEIGQADPGIPTMRIKGEPEGPYTARISKDYKRVTGRDVPMVEGTGVANIDQLKQRNAEISQILEGGTPPPGARVPTLPRTVDISPAMDEIDRILTKEVSPGTPGHTAVSKIREVLLGAEGNARKIDNIKKQSIDEILNAEKVAPEMRRWMRLIKKQLTASMDDQLPDYNAARGIYGKFGMRKPMEDLELSAIGIISKYEKVKDVEGAMSQIFGVGGEIPSYENLLRVRRVIMKEDPALWRRTVAHYIRKQYGRAQAAQSGDVINIAGKMHQKLFGSKDKQRAMSAAFGGENTAGYKNFKGLMLVLQRAAGGKAGQSITHFAGEVKKNMAPRMEGQRLRNFLKHPYDYAVDASINWWNDLLMRGRQEELLEALVDPAIQKKISTIKRISPKSQKYAEGLAMLTALVATKIEPKRPEWRDTDVEPEQR